MEDVLREIQQNVEWLLGLEAERLAVGQMVLRAIIIYIAALVMVRIGQKRFLGRNTAFDLILGIILGSVVSRAINGSGEFFPTIASGFALVFLHWFFAALAFRYDRFGNLVKGRPRTLIEEGSIVWDAMRKSNISRTDLNTALRLELNQDDLDGVRQARLERSGDISFVTAESSPHVIEVEVAQGVQTIRIRLE
jgi:uncharacterized membrane protein YcaP (DUF421 family)